MSAITVVGVAPDGLAAGGVEAVADAALVVGGGRHLARWVRGEVATQAIGGDLTPAMDAIAAAHGKVVVLASGDPGFFGIVRALSERFGRHGLRVLPAVSSVALAFAATGLHWDDAVVVSAHGRPSEAAVHACLAHPKVAVLTAPGFGPAELARALLAAEAGGRRAVVVERLGEPDARVVEGSLQDIATAGAFRDPNVVVVLHEARAQGRDHEARAQGRDHEARAEGRDDDPHAPAGKGVTFPTRQVPEAWALPTDAFTHRDGMISKPEVRALALAALGPGLGDLVWDVGAGSGSVAVECARFGAAVVAVDRDEQACDLVRRNAAAHGVALRVVHGQAPAALRALPAPDAVFVGGGGVSLPAILDEVCRRTRRAVVAALATVERVGPAVETLERAGWEVHARMVQVSDLTPIGAAHRLAAHNPVFLVEGRRP